MAPDAMAPLVFLGCSTEALRLVPVIQNTLADKAIVQPWNQGFFLPGSYVLETLISKGDRFDFAILLFADDDIVEIRGEKMLAVRDNTVLEAGFFIGRLGRERTFIMVPNVPNLRLPTDFAGLTHVPYQVNYPSDLEQAIISQSCYVIRNTITRTGRRKPFFEKNISSGMVHLLKTVHLASISSAVHPKVVAGAGKTGST
jgi:predicted nucleotide-binding protein